MAKNFKYMSADKLASHYLGITFEQLKNQCDLRGCSPLKPFTNLQIHPTGAGVYYVQKVEKDECSTIFYFDTLDLIEPLVGLEEEVLLTR